MYPPPISGGAPSLLATSIRANWAGRHWQSSTTNRNHATTRRARDRVLRDRMPHLLRCRSLLMRWQSLRSFTSLPRSRSRMVIGFSRIWSMCAMALPESRRAPALPHRSGHVQTRTEHAIHRRASAGLLVSMEQKLLMLKLPLSLPERPPSPRRGQSREASSRIPILPTPKH